MPVILKRLSSIAASLLVPLNCLLIFLVIMENRVVVPSWLQVAGRMHPLVLHFPIVLILLFFSVTNSSCRQAGAAVFSKGAWQRVVVCQRFQCGNNGPYGLFFVARTRL